MSNVIKVPRTGLDVIVEGNRYFIRNPKTGNFLYGDRVLDPQTGKRLYREDVIKSAIDTIEVSKVETAQSEKKQPVTVLENNTVAVCEADGYTKLLMRGTTAEEVIGELYDEVYSLSDFRLIDLTTMKDVKLKVEIVGG